MARDVACKYDLYAPARARGADAPAALQAGLPASSGGSDAQARVRAHVVLTTYEMAALEAAELRRLHWGVLIVDEGHRLKVKEGRLFQVCLCG